MIRLEGEEAREKLASHLRSFEVIEGEVIGRVESHPERGIEVYLNASSMEVGPLEPPLPKFLRFENGLVLSSEEGRLNWKQVDPDILDLGIQSIMLYDPRVYMKALQEGVIGEVGIESLGSAERFGFQLRTLEMGTRVLGMPVETSVSWARANGEVIYVELTLLKEYFDLKLGEDPSEGWIRYPR